MQRICCVPERCGGGVRQRAGRDARRAAVRPGGSRSRWPRGAGPR